jgi:large repetitive protein
MKIKKYLFGGLIALLALTAFAPLAVPTKPGLVSPINKVVKVDPDNVTLKWSKSTATRLSTLSDYDVEISTSSAAQTDGSFVSTVDTSVVASPDVTYTIPAGTLNYGTTYYWHVRANDSVPSTSAWSATGVFRVAVEPPTAVAFVPATDLLTLRPTFKWTPGAQNANSYTIQISIDSGFSTIYRTATVAASAIPANQYIPTTNLLPNVLFYWRVRANNSTLGTSDWSVPVSFTTANPPSVPVLVSPNGTRVSDTPSLIWKIVSLQGAWTFDTYQVEIFDTYVNVDSLTPVFTANNTLNDATGTDPSLGDQDGLGTSTTTYYNIPSTAGLLPATTYYWRIKAFNSNGEYSTSTLYKFYTSIVGKIDATTMDPGSTLGNVSGLEGPTFATTKTISGYTGTVRENVNLLSLYPTFKWDTTGVLNAQTFTLQIASYASNSCNLTAPNNSTFKSTILNVTLSYTETEYSSNLEKYPNYILCWRIRGNHSTYGSSDWSDVQIFQVANPPGIPELVNPIDGTLTNDSSPRLEWKQATLPSGTTFAKYEVEIAYTSKFDGGTHPTYSYPANTIPPYPTPIAYPLPYPILPDNPVDDPVYAVTPPASLFPKFPMIQQAYDSNEASTTFGNTNKINEPWFDIPTETTVTPAGDPLYGGHTYYWRVRTYNSAGEYSAWSKIRSIRIMLDRPENLTLTDCAGTAVTDALTPRPCFDWNDVYNAYRYRIVIATDQNFKKVIYNNWASGLGSFHQPNVDLPKGKTLYWKVSANTPFGYGTSVASSPIKSFTSANPPNTPIPVSPIANKLVIPTTLEPNPVFRWAKPSYPLGTTFDHYEIEIAQDTKFAHLVEPAASTTAGDEYELSYAVAAGILTPARTYYWHVRACNDETPNECSTWSATNTFRTSVGTPTLVTPPDTTTLGTPLRPYFEWNTVNDATSYSIWISKASTCTKPVASATTSYTILYYQPKANLAAGTTYYWCVRANNKTYGPGAWSLIDSFSTP